MTTRSLASALLFALVGVAASVSASAVTVGDEMVVEPQAASTLTREQVRAETLAALKRGEVQHSGYDQWESAVVRNDHRLTQPVASTVSREQVQAEARAFYKSHPNAQFQRDTYGVAG